NVIGKGYNVLNDAAEATQTDAARQAKGTLTLNIWLSAAFDAAYAANPSSISRKFVVDPESLDMKVIERVEMFDFSSFWAQMMGPMVFVCK
ncbi:hypothetical protein LTS18_003844, partial [Coniosporium uncinatum]